MNITEQQKELVLARFKTLNPESKILLGGHKEISVREIIDHIEKGDDFGQRAVQVQIQMLKMLTGG